MKKQGLIAAVIFCLLGLPASTVIADLAVTFVGPNPFSGFPSTGGTGTFGGTNPVTILKTFTSLGDVPIIIQRHPPSAVQNGALPAVEALNITERVTNNTGVDWTDFHMLMQPIDANPLLSVQFLGVTNSTGQWTTITPGLNSLNLFGLVKNGDTFSLSFTLQVTTDQFSNDLFGIHEFPTVPSPSASVLAMLGCSILGAVSRPRSRRESV
jgi:hypothetical protein